jgi:hypothetical protein
VTVLEFFFCGDTDVMGVSYYCLWLFMCCYLLRYDFL